jgi:hypothetical protein
LTQAPDLPALYSSHRVVLWVEDEETRTYLATAWQDGDIKLLVAGGHTNIAAIVKAAENDQIPHVFGVRDRDFDQSNYSRWTTEPDSAPGVPEVRVFISETFELENLMLDAKAMAECEVHTAGKDVLTIQAELDALAAKLAWWMSCRKTIVHFRDTSTKDSIKHPPRGEVTTKAHALNKIVSSKWWTTTLPGLGNVVTATEADRLLDFHHRAYSFALEDGSWRTSFSGKEILGEMRSRLWTRNQERDPGGKLHLVRAIAEAQRTLGLPPEIRELHAVLRARVNLPP